MGLLAYIILHGVKRRLQINFRGGREAALSTT